MKALEARLYGTMVAFMQRVQRAADAALEGRGVSPAQFFILATVARQGELRQSELAERLGVTAANVSQLVSKLVEGRLVSRTEDGKAKIVRLTAKGLRLVAELTPEHDAFLRSRFEKLTLQERTELLSLVAKLTEE
jgi:DNA-binding MarR family transcriptional regulator